MRAARFPATPEVQGDPDPPGAEDARLEAAAAREGQGGGERDEGGLSPDQGQSGFSSHGERREVGTSLHEGQQQEELVPPPTLHETQQELEAQARMWREHQQRPQVEQAQQQV